MDRNALVLGGKTEFGRYKKGGKTGKAPLLPLTWTVLEISGDEALLLCDHLTAARPFHTEEGAVTWKDCSLREWLNGDFIKEAFSVEEIAMLCCGPHADDPDAADRVFLLSAEEIERFLRPEEAVTANGIRYVPARAALVLGSQKKSGLEYWWTRTCTAADPRFGTMVRHVDPNGYMLSGGNSPSYLDRWVRPACRIRIS